MSSSHEPDVETAHEISNTPEPGAVQTRTREVEQERLPRMSFPVAASLLSGLGLALVAVSLGGFFPPAWTWNHLVVHAVVEALGAFAALTFAGLLLLVLGRERSFNHRLWIACAFIGIGVLDGFHASQFPGLPFVWFRSVATLTGGFFFALAWLPDRASASGLRRWLPLTVAVAAALFGVGSIVLQRELPAMMTGGDFTPVAKAINLIGGLLLLAASARFLLLYRDRRVFDDFLFAGLCLLFGVAGLLFPFSRFWNAEWWFWHFLRLLAYIVVISWMLVLYQRALTGLRRARDELELRVEERTRTLAKTNGLMQSTLGSIGDAVIATDQNGSVTFLNAVAQELTGWKQEEAQGKSLDLVFDIINRETRQPVENPVKKIFRAGKVVGLADHTVLISKDRREFDIEDSAAPIITSEGERIGVVLVFRDVTERRRIEEERERFFNLSRDMICIAGFDGYFKRLNPAWEKTLGFTPGELLSAPYLSFVHPDNHEATSAEAAKLAAGLETISFENRYRCKDGSYKWILWSCTPSVGHQLIYAVAHDITERKEAEETILRAKEEAERTSKFKDQFLSTMSHELRTPLNAVLGFSELLTDDRYGPLNDKQRRYVGHIHSGGQHLLKLINDILDLSKIEAGRLELSLEEVPLAATFGEILSVLRPLADKKSLQLIHEGAAKLAVRVDAMRFKQILMNLLGNAIKFTPEGGRIELVARSVDSKVRVEVRDSGPGVPPEEQKRIFEAFYRLRVSGQAPEGTGLGLAITQRLVELHGGELGLESQPGQGSCFYFSLPASVGFARAPKGNERISEKPDGVPKILIIEDDLTAAHLIETQLSASGYAPVICDQPLRAVEIAAELRPHAITLDLLMKPVTGWEILLQLKTDLHTKSIPVIVLTIVDQPGMGLTLGADEYLIKPVEKEALLAAITRCLASRGSTRAPRPILVVEDDAATREVIAELLQTNGYAVATAADGALARAAVEAALPELVILDLLLPNVSGFELLAEWRASPRTADLPVFVLTGKDLTPAEQETLRAQAELLLRKQQPWQEDLVRQLRRALPVAGRPEGS